VCAWRLLLLSVGPPRWIWSSGTMLQVGRGMLRRRVCDEALRSCRTVGARVHFLRPTGAVAVTRRHCASDSSSEPRAVSPKIEALVEEIASLSLLEAAELTDALKDKLGITASAMMMPPGGGVAVAPAAGGGAAAAPAEEAPAPAAEKTHFTIKLDKFDTGSKIKLIKEVRAYTGLGLKEAKELVESAPCEIKADVAKEEAESVKAKLEGVGGTVLLE